MPLTSEEGRRLHVLGLFECGQITTAQAAEALVLTPPQIRRLRATVSPVLESDTSIVVNAGTAGNRTGEPHGPGPGGLPGLPR